MSEENPFEPRIGRRRSSEGRARSFTGRAMAAAVRAGYVRHRTPRRGGPRNGRGRGAALAASLRSPSRQVIVKARIVRQSGRSWRAAPLAEHLRYLRRDGVDREGGRGQVFDARGPADASAFAGRCQGDRHHFRFIVSPEDAAELCDLAAFGRELMASAERDLCTRLDWVAVEHWNTAHPHLHILVRGKDDAGADLLIAGEYISHGLRARAEALASLELGPRTGREIARSLERDITGEGWSRLDPFIADRVVDGRLDLRGGPGGSDPELRPLLVGRAVTLERLGLAVPEAVGAWRIDPRWRERLADLAERARILSALQRVGGEARGHGEFVPYAEALELPVTGRLADRGLHDELSGRAYVVVDGIDGRLHHLRLPDLAAAGDTPVGGLVQARPAREGAKILALSDLCLADQVTAHGATWLDRQLATREPEPLADSGFGGEVRRALAARLARLEQEGLASPTPAGPGLAPGLLRRLQERDLAAAGAEISKRSGLVYRGPVEDPVVRGRYVRRLSLASGRFAMIEDGLGFRLAPWAPALERSLGHEVRGVMGPAGVDWDRGRGLSR